MLIHILITEMSKWSWLWLLRQLSSPTIWRKITKYNHWIQIVSDHISQVLCILSSSAVLNCELTVQTLLSSTFRLYGSLPNWKRDFLNLSTRRRLMLWCGAGGSWKLNKCRLLPTNTNVTTAVRQNIRHGLISKYEKKTAGPNSLTDRVFLWLHLWFLTHEIHQIFLYAFTWVMKIILCSCTRSLWMGSSIWRSFFCETQIPADTGVRAKPTNWLMSAKESHVGSF